VYSPKAFRPSILVAAVGIIMFLFTVLRENTVPSAPADKCRDSTISYPTTASFQILSNSYCSMWTRCRVTVTKGRQFLGQQNFINGVTQPISRQRVGKHVPAATDTNATIEERCFLCRPCRGVIARTVGAMSLVEFCKGVCEDGT
jgi:hypothetical protein